jgi:putative ABC transport system ATP-binding protein
MAECECSGRFSFKRHVIDGVLCMLIELEDVTKIYNRNQINEVIALDTVNLQIDSNSMVCLRGASGSGKSTLLSIIGCVFQPTRGRVTVAGKKLSRLPDRFMTLHRRRSIGFIFQTFNILPNLTVRDNIILPLIPLGISPARQISGGELQRVAIARALIHNPPLVLADEPTAHLDSRLSEEFMDLMADLKSAGKTIIITSHDPVVTEHPAIDRIIDIKDGRIHVS